MQSVLSVSTAKALDDFAAKIPAIYAKFEYVSAKEERAACVEKCLSNIVAIHNASLETTGKKEGDKVILNGQEVIIGGEKTIRRLAQQAINKHETEMEPDFWEKAPSNDRIWFSHGEHPETTTSHVNRAAKAPKNDIFTQWQAKKAAQSAAKAPKNDIFTQWRAKKAAESA